jgi:NADH dehydrogenase (ubiquinone) 1 alpha/beta subcomplex 1
MIAARALPRLVARSTPRATPIARTLVSLAPRRPAPSSSLSLLARRAYSAEGLNPDEVKHRIMEILLTFDKCDPKTVSDKAHFVQDLGLDSLDVVEVVMAVEEEFSLEVRTLPSSPCELESRARPRSPTKPPTASCPCPTPSPTSLLNQRVRPSSCPSHSQGEADARTAI